MNWSKHYTYDESCPSGLRSNRAGKPVGVLGNHGYYQINLRSTGVKLAHRVIWEMTYGPIPEGMEVDHIDRHRNNNKLSNLRLVTSCENSWNTSGHKDSKTGEKNISFHQKGYAIEVMRCGSRMRTTRPTLEEAIAVRDLMLEGLYVKEDRC